MDTGLASGIYTASNTGLLRGSERGLINGLHSGILNESLLQNEIVTSGIHICLDASNPYSSPNNNVTWKDLSPNGYNGTLTNGAYLDTANRNGIFLDGTNDYVNCGSTSAGNNSSSFTVCGWLYPMSGGGQYPICRGNDGFGSGWSIFLRELFSVVQVVSGVPTQYSTGSVPLRNNTWGYYCGVFSIDDGKLYFYYNGNLRSTANCSAGSALRSSTRGWIFGLVSSVGPYWKGKLGLVNIYNRVLTPAEISQNFLSTKHRFGL